MIDTERGGLALSYVRGVCLLGTEGLCHEADQGHHVRGLGQAGRGGELSGLQYHVIDRLTITTKPRLTPQGPEGFYLQDHHLGDDHRCPRPRDLEERDQGLSAGPGDLGRRGGLHGEDLRVPEAKPTGHQRGMGSSLRHRPKRTSSLLLTRTFWML